MDQICVVFRFERSNVEAHRSKTGPKHGQKNVEGLRLCPYRSHRTRHRNGYQKEKQIVYGNGAAILRMTYQQNCANDEARNRQKGNCWLVEPRTNSLREKGSGEGKRKCY